MHVCSPRIAAKARPADDLTEWNLVLHCRRSGPKRPWAAPRSAGSIWRIHLFDHVGYANRPALFQSADEAGIHCVHLAEHHCSPVNMVSVPGVFLGALARSTMLGYMMFGDMSLPDALRSLDLFAVEVMPSVADL